MYKIAGDTHTHTISCAHAYSTITENALAAAQLKHDFLITTEHTVSVPGAPTATFFKNLPKSVPRILHNVLMLFGCEVNILTDGTIDMEQNVLESLDWVVASMHGGIMEVGLEKSRYTEFWLNILDNPAIDCLGHIGTPKYSCHYEAIVRKAAEKNKIIEINSASHMVRLGSTENCLKVAELCKKYSVRVALSSDAHFHARVGDVKHSCDILSKVDFPEELVLNSSYDKIYEYITQKRDVLLPKPAELAKYRSENFTAN